MTVTLKVSIKEFEDTMVIARKGEINFERTKKLQTPLQERDSEDRGMEF